MKSSTISLLAFCILVIYGCKKIINVNLNDASPQIVIEGNIYNTAGPYQVKISKTVNFSASNIYPGVSGAFVKVADITSGVTNILSETFAGLYITSSLQGVPGHTYQLTVITGGQTYTASSTMPQAITLDSIGFQHNAGNVGSNINPVVNFQDPAGINNYYNFTQFVNGIQLKSLNPFSDRLSDGRYISQQLFNDSSYIRIGDTVLVQMNCIDKNVWNFFNTLVEATNGNSFQSAAPANPISNLSNNALGYFSASTINTKKRVAF